MKLRDYVKMQEKEQAAQLRWGLSKIDGLGRTGLRALFDLQSSKENTSRLRTRARLNWIGDKLTVDEIWDAEKVDSMQPSRSRRKHT